MTDARPTAGSHPPDDQSADGEATQPASGGGTDPDRKGPAAVPPARLLGPPLAPGELGRLGGYRVLEVLGQGGMGVVYRAEDPRLRRPVAVKVMRPDVAADHRAAERFLLEARAAAAVKHDHIVTIYQVGQDR